jgi:tripartite-type tricarboxylate transporter receptor subunit TctC
MKRKFLKSVLALCCGLAMSVAHAQSYPSKPIRLIVPFPPGGGNDVIARVIAQKLSERLGQQVVVDNRAGANGIVGLQALMQSPPDGYTLAVGAAGPLAVNPSLYDKLPYDPLKDFSPITNMVNYPLLLVVHPSVPAKTTQDLVNLAKAKPKQLYFASPGSGNSGHLAGQCANRACALQGAGACVVGFDFWPGANALQQHSLGVTPGQVGAIERPGRGQCQACALVARHSHHF